jgi:hypothetical protein
LITGDEWHAITGGEVVQERFSNGKDLAAHDSNLSAQQAVEQVVLARGHPGFPS